MHYPPHVSFLAPLHATFIYKHLNSQQLKVFRYTCLTCVDVQRNRHCCSIVKKVSNGSIYRYRTPPHTPRYRSLVLYSSPVFIILSLSAMFLKLFTYSIKKKTTIYLSIYLSIIIIFFNYPCLKSKSTITCSFIGSF